jgi:glyoxylase-like metal-dependent hydrolase (beta-lactamase superfamily II)
VTLKEVLRKENATIEAVLVTHFHGDHLGGVHDVRTLSPRPDVHKNNHPDLPGLDLALSDIRDGQLFAVPGATLRAVHSPGHTRDHMAFVLEEEDALFTGDCVLGHGTVVFEDLPAYLRTLEMLAAQVKGRAYPGHGQFLEDGPARIREYIAHRATREREVVTALAKGTAGAQDGAGLASMDLVRMIYQDTPENLHFAASRGVVQILEKLLAEGKVVHDEELNTWMPVEKAVL